MLDALVEGRPFPELCEAVAPFTGEEQAPPAPPACYGPWSRAA